MKKVTLKDGSRVVIRRLTANDADKSHAFFRGLPPEDRSYLRRDVTRRAFVKERIREMERGHIRRLVAVSEGEIVADGTLELDGPGWKGHVGEIRLIVGRPFQRRGLGMRMARELYLLAARKGLEEIVVKMMEPQKAAISIFERLGFRKDATFSAYVKDQAGTKQNLIVMRCDLNSLWEKLEDYFAATDWQRTR